MSRQGCAGNSELEVGFGCPVKTCGNPYLEYHHFDPPWRDKQHHDPKGMIALCAEHHRKAEGGAFTAEQLRQFKVEGFDRNDHVKGRFDWRRKDLLVSVEGGYSSVNTPVPVSFNGAPVVMLTQDENSELLVSVNMLTTSVMPRLQMFENDWVSTGQPKDILCPPSGKKIQASYANGDRISIEFFAINNEDLLAARLGNWGSSRSSLLADGDIAFPLVLVSIEIEVPEAGISIVRGSTSTPMMHVSDMTCSSALCAVSLGHIKPPFPSAIRAFIDREGVNLRLASMNAPNLWSTSNRSFEGIPILLDGFQFEECTFRRCWMGTRGNPFMLQNCHLEDVGELPLADEIVNSAKAIFALTKCRFPTFASLTNGLRQSSAQPMDDDSPPDS